MMQMIELIRTTLIEIWNCIVGIIFYGLILGQFQLDSSAQIFKVLKNVKNFVSATSMKSCFGMPTFFILKLKVKFC